MPETSFKQPVAGLEEQNSKDRWRNYLFKDITHKHAMDWMRSKPLRQQQAFARAVNKVRGKGFI